MGSVFSAFDNQLQRKVAVKFIDNLDPQRVRRFIREARAQARVDHPHVAGIFDVGQVRGRPYIAMHYIAGETLDAAARQMNLEQKLLVMKKVALGVQQAHAAGLIHRDLKPRNIMVEPDPDGGYKPYVLDFGLARLGESGTMTADGTVMGTPGYMAPEQARGEIENLDRRADVYALGATLYHLVTGGAPFAGSNPAEILLDILEKDPPKPGQSVPGLPRDIETIILKCMAKQPEVRYGSARELADDLDRYLRGEPIQARPASFWYRMARKASRNRPLVFVSLAAIIILILSGLWNAVNAKRAQAREVLVRDLTEEVKEIEAAIRHYYLSPPHDIRPDRRVIQERIDSLGRGMDQRGDWAAGPLHYARGLGFYALEDLDKARSHLEAAWDADYRGPETAFALGLVYSKIYRRELDRPIVFEDNRSRKKRRATLAARWRRPSLEKMRLAKGSDSAPPDYLRALIAFSEERFEEALAALDLCKQNPWFFEAYHLEGDVFRQQAFMFREKGMNDEARRAFTRALEAYAEAGAIARSNPGIPMSAAAAYAQMLVMDLFSGDRFQQHLDAGLAQVRNAAFLDPEKSEIHLLEARLHILAAEHQRLAAEDPVPYYESAVAAGLRAAVSNPSAAGLVLGDAYWRHARRLQQLNRHAENLIVQAVTHLDRVLPNDRNAMYFRTLGNANKALARLHQQDTAGHYDRALNAFRQAVRLGGSDISNYQALASCLREVAGTVAPEQATGLLTEAVKQLEAALEIQPDHWVLLLYAGRTWMSLAQGGSPQLETLDLEQTQKALGCYDQALALNPPLTHHLHAAVGTVWYECARYNYIQGEDPFPYFQKADEAFQKAATEAPGAWQYLVNQAQSAYFRGKYLVRQGKDPGNALDQAHAYIQRALSLAETTSARLFLANVHRLEAERHWQTGRDWTASVEKAVEALNTILADRPEHAEALRTVTRLFTLKARIVQAAGGDPDPALNKARDAFQQAFAQHPKAPSFLLAGAYLYLHKAYLAKEKGTLPNTAVEAGLQLCSAVPKGHPRATEALALDAVFHLLKAGDDPTMAEKARAQLRRALTMNPFLEYRHRRFL